MMTAISQMADFPNIEGKAKDEVRKMAQEVMQETMKRVQF